VQATSGGALYRKSSFLLDSLGQQIFPSHIQIVEDPHLIGGVGSAPFDEEGVRTQTRKVVSDGVLQGYFLSTYSARKLGMQTTGNAGGSHNLEMLSKDTKIADDFEGMLRKMGTGLLVTELMGRRQHARDVPADRRHRQRRAHPRQQDDGLDPARKNGRRGQLIRRRQRAAAKPGRPARVFVVPVIMFSQAIALSTD
jgi:hypothetical protein